MLRQVSILILATAALAAPPDSVTSIIDEARGAPVEVFADVVFHLIETNQIPQKDRVALLDEVFLRASEAREAMPKRPAVTRSGSAALAAAPLRAAPGVATTYSTAPQSAVPIPAQLRLDTLSVQCRVVKALLGIDGKHARSLFSRIPRPDLPKPDCKTAILEDPSQYFEIVEAVVTKAPFSEKEQAEGVPFWTMENEVRSIRTSLEIIPAARGFSYLVRNEKEALALESAFAAALAIDDTDRDFSAAVGDHLVDALQVSEDLLAKWGAPSQALQAALRGYLVRHLTGARCEDSSTDYTGAVAAFNASVSRQSAVPPLAGEETTPSKVEGRADISKSSVYAAYPDLLKSVDALLRDPNPSTDVLTRLHEWEAADGEDPVGVFHRKVNLYRTLLRPNMPDPFSGRPRGALLPAILAGLIAALSDTAILDLAPCDWLEEVHNVVPQMTMPRTYFAAPDLAEALAASRPAALQIYGHLAVLEQPAFAIPDKK